MNYVEEGDGPLVVLLHGFPEYWYSWRRQIPALAAAGFRAVAVDLPGYNDSPKPRDVSEYRISAVVAQVAALIEKLGAPCTLVGHDWGGITAWYLAMTRPELVRKLAVLNVAHPIPFLREVKNNPRQRRRLIYQLFFQLPLLPELLMPLILPRFLRWAGKFSADEIAKYRQSWRKPGVMRAMANYYRALARYRGELRKLCKPIDIPTLLIWAQREPVFTRASTENFDEWVPNLKIVRIADAGHFVQTDAPEIVNEALVEFLTSSSSP